jgi:hypothetical protein
MRVFILYRYSSKNSIRLSDRRERDGNALEKCEMRTKFWFQNVKGLHHFDDVVAEGRIIL